MDGTYASGQTTAGAERYIPVNLSSDMAWLKEIPGSISLEVTMKWAGGNKDLDPEIRKSLSLAMALTQSGSLFSEAFWDKAGFYGWPKIAANAE